MRQLARLPISPNRLAQLPFFVIMIVGGSLLTVWIRNLTRHYDTFSLSFYRFLAGSIFLLALSVKYYPAELRGIVRSPKRFAGVAFMSVLYVVIQVFLVLGLARTPAVMSTLINLASLPLAFGLAYAIFPEERAVAANRQFLIGAAIALGSAIGLALTNGAGNLEYSRGLGYLVVSALLAVATSLLAKRMMLAFHPVPYSGVVNALMAIFLLGLGLVWGDLSSWLRAPLPAQLGVLGSGVYGQIFGTLMFLVAIRRFGVVTTRMADLSAPVSVGLLGFILVGETIQPAQVGFGLALIAGCYVLLRAKTTPPPRAA